MDYKELKKQTQICLTDVLEKSALSSSDIFVLGSSSSEGVRTWPGKISSQEVGGVCKLAMQVVIPTWSFT